MKLSSDPVAGASTVKTYLPRYEGLSGLKVAEIISTHQKSLGLTGVSKVDMIKSTLVAGIGFINLFEVTIDGITDLSQLQLISLKGFKRGELKAELVERLSEQFQDLDANSVYLFEYPDGFILSLNNHMLSLIPRWHS